MTKNAFSHRPPKSWLKITLTVPGDKVDHLAAFLTDLSGGGIEQIPDPENQALETVIGYLPVDRELTEKKQRLNDFCSHLLGKPAPGGTGCFSSEIIEEEDWGRTWKKQFKPLEITPHLVIKPTWEDYVPAAHQKIISLDPGMAFGTGHHASTRLALELIESAILTDRVKHEQMLDVGTGTGILAMAGALLGAGQVTAIDNDPDAVAVARENVLLNNLADLVTINDQELSTLPQRFDLIIANITHDTLIDMAPLLTERLTRGGALILAGILRGEQEDNIRRTYEKSGLVTMTTRTGDEWAAFYFRKLEG